MPPASSHHKDCCRKLQLLSQQSLLAPPAQEPAGQGQVEPVVGSCFSTSPSSSGLMASTLTARARAHLCTQAHRALWGTHRPVPSARVHLDSSHPGAMCMCSWIRVCLSLLREDPLQVAVCAHTFSLGSPLSPRLLLPSSLPSQHLYCPPNLRVTRLAVDLPESTVWEVFSCSSPPARSPPSLCGSLSILCPALRALHSAGGQVCPAGLGGLFPRGAAWISILGGHVSICPERSCHFNTHVT